jgi:intergrase/recombinase
MDSFYVKKIQILTPTTLDSMLEVIDKPFQRRRFLTLLYSGMRYAEYLRFYDNPDWYIKSRNSIHLPEHATKKAKRKQLERYVHPLPDMMREIIEPFHKDPKPPTLQTWNENLKRWAIKAGIDPTGISAKTTRKTIESWMIVAGVPVNVVYLRQGHDELTSLQHYQGLPFTPSEKEEIKRRLAGWV